MFTEEEIRTAKATREVILTCDVDALKAVYMSGEICMWAEMQEKWQKDTSLKTTPLSITKGES
jgi:hypothetical protein